MSYVNNMHNKHSFALFMPRVELCLTSSGITCITSSTTSIPSTLSPKYKKPTLSKYRWGHQAVNILYMNQAQNIIRSASPISTSSTSSISSHHLHTASVGTSKVMQGTKVLSCTFLVPTFLQNPRNPERNQEFVGIPEEFLIID